MMPSGATFAPGCAYVDDDQSLGQRWSARSTFSVSRPMLLVVLNDCVTDTNETKTSRSRYLRRDSVAVF
jgi:hypothetical protein